MKVKDLIRELLDYNMDAEIFVVVHCRKEEFTITYGGSQDCTKQNTDSIGIYVDRLCTNEQVKQ